jgi:uncharacterized membrane protein YdjX (TVP38/TMEM64 family)
VSDFWRIWRFPLLIVAALLLPVLVLGLAFEDDVQRWVSSDWSAATRFWVIVAALAGDILLPVPSSGVSTYAGGTLGVVVGTCASSLGMTLGAIAGFAVARLLGRPFAVRHGGSDVPAIDAFAQRYGVAALVLTRPLPLLAEACVLASGASRMSWRRFLLPVMLSNLAIALIYAAAGAYFEQRQSLAEGVTIAVLLPLGIVLLVRRYWRKPNTPDEITSD